MAEGPAGEPVRLVVDASQSSDPDNDIVSYVWDFGDAPSAPGITTCLDPNAGPQSMNTRHPASTR